MDTETAKSIFGEDGNPSRYGTGMMGTNAVADLAKTFLFDKNAMGWDKANALAAFFPYGGKQIVRTAQGLSTVIQGGSYKTNKDGEEQLQFRVDKNAENYIKGGLFGKWALDGARDYVAGGFKPLSADHTKAYKNATANGVDGAYALMLIDQYKGLKSTSDVDGKEGTKPYKFRKALFDDSSITTEQKQMLERDILGENKADFSSELAFKASMMDGKAPERFKGYVKAGIPEETAMKIVEWKKGNNSGEKKVREYLKTLKLTDRQIEAVIGIN